MLLRPVEWGFSMVKEKKQKGEDYPEDDLVEAFLRRDNVSNGYKKIVVSRNDIEQVKKYNNQVRNDVRRCNKEHQKYSIMKLKK